MFDQTVDETRSNVRDGYELVRQLHYRDAWTSVERMLDALEQHHLALLDQIQAGARIITDLDLNLRSIAEKAGV